MTLLTRSVPFQLSREAVEGDGLTLDGYAAVFGTPTAIDSWEGSFDEQIAPGAFRDSIRQRTPVMQFDHGRHPMVGSIPLGRIDTLREDKTGLYVNARLHDNWLVQPVRDAIASGSVDGMSFRFEVVKDEWRDGDGNLITDRDEIMRRIYGGGGKKDRLLRTLRKLNVPELGPVVFPAYRETTVSVRSEQLADVLGNEDVRADLARLLYRSPETSVGVGAPDDDGEHADEPSQLPAPAISTTARDNLLRYAKREVIK